MKTSLRLRFALSVTASAFVFAASVAEGQITVPTGFVDSLVATVGSPTDLAFLPDGRLLITTQPGALRVYCPNNTLPGCSGVGASGGLLTTPALSFTVAQICSNSERGLLGVAVDPAFVASNPNGTSNFIYLYYTANIHASCTTGGGASPPPPTIPVNRVSRFTYNTANNTAGSELVLVDNMLSPGGNHNAGGVGFGKDGYLYITVGDGGADYAGDSGTQGGNDASRDENRLEGKVLRITSTGGIPPSNPWASTGDVCAVAGGTTAGHRCQETFSWGHRNPFRFTFDPNAAGTRFFIDEVGEGSWEEINEGQAGADFGWPCREGKHVQSSTGKCNPAPPNMVDPIFEYPHGTITGTTITGANCIAGGAFVPTGIWPAAYNGMYLAADYGAGGIFKMTTAAPYVASDFGSGFGGNSITNMRFGPYLTTQALYYTSYAAGGAVHRIATSLPKAVATSNIQGGPAPPVTVTFSGAGSTDPNNLALTYVWNFGDGTLVQTTSLVTIQHTFANLGTYTVTLNVRNTNNQTSDPATVLIDVGPVPYYTVSPCRVIDTRGAAGVPIGGPALASGAANVRTFTLSPQCGVPAGVRAVAVNLTVVGPTLPGDLRFFPPGGQANTSALNFGPGQIRANNAVVSLDASGRFSVICDMAGTGTTHFILDVVGYFQ